MTWNPYHHLLDEPDDNDRAEHRADMADGLAIPYGSTPPPPRDSHYGDMAILDQHRQEHGRGHRSK